MAFATGPAARFANVQGDPDQVYVLNRHPRALRIFLIGSGGVVADKTVDLGLVGEVKGSILPTVAGMTARATGPVAGDVYAKVVYGFGGLAQVDALLLTLGEGGRTFPQPVGTGNELFSLNIMTAKTLFGYLCGVWFPG